MCIPGPQYGLWRWHGTVDQTSTEMRPSSVAANHDRYQSGAAPARASDNGRRPGEASVPLEQVISACPRIRPKLTKDWVDFAEAGSGSSQGTVMSFAQTRRRPM